ncbi:MAG: hypothetical protein EBR52_09245, partial [Microbacteriaceae bacterium]|nr:hypothetical protein [Microbacteriaceae bacterium]
LVGGSTNVNSYDRPTKSGGNGTTYSSNTSTTYYLVIDLGQSRTFNRAVYYQMFADGKTTHAAMDYSTSLLTYSDAGWTQAHAEGALDNVDRTGLTTGLLSGTQGNLVSDFSTVTARYVRLRLRNTGAFNDPYYVELYKLKLFNSAGSIQTIAATGATTISPTVSEPDSTVTYQWTNQTPGVGTVTFASPTSASTSMTANTVGTYTVRLTATNQVGLSSYIDYYLQWNPTAPTITIGSPSRSVVAPGYTVTYMVTYSGYSSTSLSLVTVNGSGASASASVSGAGSSYVVTLSSITGSGTLSFTIPAGSATNYGASAPSATSSTVTVDSTNPTITSPSVPTLGNTATPTISFTLSEPATVALYSASGCSSGSLGTQVFSSSGNVSMATSALTPSDIPTTIYARATDTALNTGACVTVGSYTYDNVAPTVSSVTSSTANGSYKAGDTISIQVNISEVVTVDGT